MKSYLSLFKIKLIANLQYRLAAITGIATQVFFGLIIIMVYIAFYKSNPNQDVPMNLHNIISYLWLVQIFFSITYYAEYIREIGNKILNGDVCYELVRPQNVYFRWFTQIISIKFSFILIKALPMVLLLMLIPKTSEFAFTINPTIPVFLTFILSFFLALILITSLNLLLHIFIFLTLENRGVLSFANTVGSLFSGTLVPIALLPNFLQKISAILPFKYFVDFPFNILINNVLNDSIYHGILIQVIWIVVIMGIGYLFMNVALKRTVVQGG